MKTLIGILLMISAQGNAAVQRGAGGSTVSTATFVNGATSGVTGQLAKWSDASTLATTNWSEPGGNLTSTGSIIAGSGFFGSPPTVSSFSSTGKLTMDNSSQIIIATGTLALPSLSVNGHTSGLFSSGNNRLDLVAGTRNVLRVFGDGVDDLVTVFGRVDAGISVRVSATGDDLPGFAGNATASRDTGMSITNLLGSDYGIAFSLNGSRGMDISPSMQVHFSSGISASSGTFSGDIKAVNANFSGALAVSSSLSASSGTIGISPNVSTITTTGQFELKPGSTIATNGVFTISTSPTAGTAGDVAFQINQNGVIHSTTQYRARLQSTNNQAIANNVQTAVFFNKQLTNVGAMHNITSSSTVTIPVDGAGWYQIHCTVEYPAFTGIATTIIKLNGGIVQEPVVIAGSGSSLTIFNVSAGMQLSNGDTLQCHATQSSGASQSICVNDFCSMSVVKIW